MRSGYETSPNPKRMYRSREKVLGGVCAGIAERMGWDILLTRLAIAVLFFSGVFSGVIFIGYFVMWAITPMRPHRMRDLSPEEERFWRDVSDRPSETFSNLRYKFRDLDDRLAGMERSVTSEEWKLRREFRDLEGGA